MKPYGTTNSAVGAPLRFKREMTRHPGKPFPHCPVRKEHRFDGKGAYAPNSSKIPASAWIGAIAVVGLFGVMFYVGAGVF